MAHKNIQSVLQEAREFPPPRSFVEHANVNAVRLQQLHERAEADYVGFWAELASTELAWHRPFTVPLRSS